MTTLPLGRPHIGEDRPTLTFIGFKADAETLEAINKLTLAATAPGVAAPRSVAIRRALIEAAERL